MAKVCVPYRHSKYKCDFGDVRLVLLDLKLIGKYLLLPYFQIAIIAPDKLVFPTAPVFSASASSDSRSHTPEGAYASRASSLSEGGQASLASRQQDFHAMCMRFRHSMAAMLRLVYLVLANKGILFDPDDVSFPRSAKSQQLSSTTERVRL
ncbi:unnamed protein product [Protopolystoma xenopodis]|uniref:Uncharacterized protein n=1 Tax=Protopolystoma xenopodis TaxID=117903 RepID=A0A3S4ZKG3_9PLAT|nr:unnamed protein product [Protopolystoma xenopodis]